MAGFRQELVGGLRPARRGEPHAGDDRGGLRRGRARLALSDDRGRARGPRRRRSRRAGHGLRGFNCTIPHKVAVVEHLDRLGRRPRSWAPSTASCAGATSSSARTPTARAFSRRCGRRRDPRRRGSCFWARRRRAGDRRRARAGRSRRHHDRQPRAPLAGRSSARCWTGWSRRPDVRVEELGTGFRVPADADLVVNATSIGLYPDVEAVVRSSSEDVAGRALVADVIPNPPETRFLGAAAELAARPSTASRCWWSRAGSASSSGPASNRTCRQCGTRSGKRSRARRRAASGRSRARRGSRPRRPA